MIGIGPRRPPGARRKARPAIEPLESRRTPTGLAFSFTLVDPTHQLDAFPMLTTELQAAGQVLGGLIGGDATVRVDVVPFSAAGGEVAHAGPEFVDTTASFQGLEVLKPAALALAQTGGDAGLDGFAPAYDIDVGFNVAATTDWFDPSGAARTAAVPADSVDVLGTLIHELIHGLGFVNFRQDADAATGAVGSIDAFSTLLAPPTAAGDTQPAYFVGPNAEAHFGGPVPIGPDLSHIARAAGSPGSAAVDLMNPVSIDGTRYAVGDVDLGILADLGYTILDYPGNAPATGPPAPGGTPVGGGGGDAGGTPPVVAPTPAPAPAPAAPTIAGVRAVPSTRGTTAVVLNVSGALDPATAGAVGAYSLGLVVGRTRTRAIALAGVSYDGAASTITIRLARPLPPGRLAHLAIRAGSIRGADGVLLDGSGHGQPGSAFAATVAGARPPVMRRHRG